MSSRRGSSASGARAAGREGSRQGDGARSHPSELETKSRPQPRDLGIAVAYWIRATHGSKSVNLGNIVEAYDMAGKGNGLLEEFTWDEAELNRAREHGPLAHKLHVDMHEVIGHASGQIEPGVGTPKETHS